MKRRKEKETQLPMEVDSAERTIPKPSDGQYLQRRADNA